MRERAAVRVGDFVRSSAEGPLMQVVSIADGIATCAWLNLRGWLKRQHFRVEELVVEPIG